MKTEKVADQSDETEEIFKKVPSILNKLTPQKFEKLTKQIMGLEYTQRSV